MLRVLGIVKETVVKNSPVLRNIGRMWVMTGLLGFASISAHADPDRTFTSAGMAGVYQGAVAIDSCTTVMLTIGVAEDGRPSVNASGNNAPTPSANAALRSFNSCTNASTFAFGNTQAFQFSAVKGGPAQPPRSITASGTIPLTDASTNITDNLTFQLTLTQFGGIISHRAGIHDTTPSGNSSVTTHLQEDSQFSFANPSLYAVSQIFGQIPLGTSSNTVGTVTYFRLHTVTISQ
ncbi:hypothetical protein MKD38_06255 [Cupriavidus sp. WGlv3]|uniref:hypothetical protein n=1 Tax=Cupriavidus sp. WGlv3 TaxID=2919924 RepID=UPI00209047F2|nr:hypothetical protein [Cupriavidus sp. WGlv3]MCO4861264.1 hypothetical protein [Cupriavidus sp. WGlv3]